jgi:conjugal transfer pilus assembly protein TraF
MRGILCFIFLSASVNANFFQEHNRGWHWYEQEDIKEKESSHDVAQSSQSPTNLISAYRKELEARLAKAWIHPTPNNIKAYQHMQKDMTDRSKIFSDVWMQSIFENPFLDHTQVSPVNQKARHVQLDLGSKKTQEVIQALSKEYGLFFFMSGECAYCQAFAPIVKQFSDFYGWSVLPITLDGSSSDVFPNTITDNGLSQQWDVKAVPALFAVNPNTGHVIPIAYGMTSLDQMETRLIKLLEKAKNR